ncbi:MAG: vitamin K epoxide reductase family protein [Patescibacteria group bacterium]
MTAYALLFTLAAIGISETVYLIRQRLLAEEPICPIGDSCAMVLASQYSKTFFIPNDVLGLLFYIMASFISAFLVIGIGPIVVWDFIFKLAVAVGALLSLFFTYLQWRIIRAWCFWCLMSAFTIWLMGIIILVSNIV